MSRPNCHAIGRAETDKFRLPVARLTERWFERPTREIRACYRHELLPQCETDGGRGRRMEGMESFHGRPGRAVRGRIERHESPVSFGVKVPTLSAPTSRVGLPLCEHVQTNFTQGRLFFLAQREGFHCASRRSRDRRMASPSRGKARPAVL